MNFEEFLKLVREHVGRYCTDSYWERVYEHLKKKDEAYIRSELPYLAINAVATDYVSKKG